MTLSEKNDHIEMDLVGDEIVDDMDQVISGEISGMKSSIEQLNERANWLNRSPHKRKVIELFENLEKIVKKLK